MVRAKAGSAMLVLGLVLGGPALAQGFSGGGAGGVAALRGTTASPGYVGGAVAADAGDARALAVPEPVAKPRPGLAPTDIDFAPRGDGFMAGVLPF